MRASTAAIVHPAAVAAPSPGDPVGALARRAWPYRTVPPASAAARTIALRRVAARELDDPAAAVSGRTASASAQPKAATTNDSSACPPALASCTTRATS